MHASESRLGNDITQSYLVSFAHGNQGEFITPPFFTVLQLYKCFRGRKTCAFCKAYNVFNKHKLRVSKPFYKQALTITNHCEL
ncbi:hypothetical protein Hanom_Chr12g01136891 [Helianthus anomalus]